MQKINSSRGSFQKKNTSNFRNNGSNRTFGPRRLNNNRNNDAKIDINAFIEKSLKTAKTITPESPVTRTFNDFGFDKLINTNLGKRGFVTPTSVQDKAIEPIMAGKDLIGLANTGTGKTAAFLLPLINKVYLDRSQKVLIIAPTRELALQIEAELRQFSWGMRIFYTSCVGGLPIGKQIASLRMRQDFVIGTPGRLKDLASRGFINFSEFNNVVLDEVDRMLDMGFVDEIKFFFSQLPQNRQSLFFSATMPDKIKSLVNAFAKEPVVIQARSGETSSNVTQEIVRVSRYDKMDKLDDLLSEPGMDKVIVFSETKREVEKLSELLIERGHMADSIHGDKRQGQRQKALKDFKEERIKVLVATDVAARGLDIKNVSHVINYSVPKTYDDYIHRIGRTGRANMSGKALTFVE